MATKPLTRRATGGVEGKKTVKEGEGRRRYNIAKPKAFPSPA